MRSSPLRSAHCVYKLILFEGALPAFIDIDPATLNMDANRRATSAAPARH
jgi:dTDP-4-amino-4,6-dideoxygalactose transaminase